MVDFVVTFATEPTIYEEDGITEIEWFEAGFDREKAFPQQRQFDIAGATWALEAFNHSGRYGERFMIYVMKFIDGKPIPVVDLVLETGVQLTIDDQIRIYGYNIDGKLIDNYLSTDSTGTYSVFVSEV